MDPVEQHQNHLSRLFESIQAGEQIDFDRELKALDWEAAIAANIYLRDAIDRINTADSELDDERRSA